MKWLVLSLIVGLMFSGCTPLQQPPAPPAQIIKEDEALKLVANNTGRILEELVKLRKIEQQANQKAIENSKVYDAPTTGPLAKKVTLSFTGPIDKTLQVLAELAGYKFPKPLGVPHFRDTIVQVDVLDTPLFKVLEDVGWQAGSRVHVILDNRNREIRLAYEGD